MIIRPDMRKQRYKLFDILVEFKYVNLKDAGLSGKDAKRMNVLNLRNIPRMRSKMTDAKKQAAQYKSVLEKKYGNSLRLKCFAVVSLCFETLVGDGLTYYS